MTQEPYTADTNDDALALSEPSLLPSSPKYVSAPVHVTAPAGHRLLLLAQELDSPISCRRLLFLPLQRRRRTTILANSAKETRRELLSKAVAIMLELFNDAAKDVTLLLELHVVGLQRFDFVFQAWESLIGQRNWDSN